MTGKYYVISFTQVHFNVLLGTCLFLLWCLDFQRNLLHLKRVVYKCLCFKKPKFISVKAIYLGDFVLFVQMLFPDSRQA